MTVGRISRALAPLLGTLALFGCGVSDLKPVPAEEHDDHGPPGAVVAGDELQSAFAVEDGWLVSAPLGAPDGATRVALMIDLRAERPDEELVLEARGLSLGDAADWVPAEIVWQEEPFAVARAELGFLADEVQVRVPVGHEALLEGLQYEAVVPEVPSVDLEPSEPDLLAPGEAEQGLAADLRNIGVISRAQWGARKSRCRSYDTGKSKIAVHHTVTPPTYNGNYAARVRQIQAFHMDGRGWCDVGYHFLVTRDGRVWEARPLKFLGSHVYGHNTDNIGVSFVGCFQPGACGGLGSTSVPERMVEGGAKVIRRLAARFDIPRTASRVKGHRDHAGAQTSCPGDNLHQRLGALRNYAPPATCGAVKRVAAQTRYQTAAELSANNFDSAKNVVIASGVDNNPGAVVAAPLARRFHAPLLLTATNTLPSATRAEIRRLGATRAFVVGGTGAVSSGVLTTLRNMGLSVERVGANNRYRTAAAVARRAGSRDDIAFVVAGNNSIAGISASAAAASLRAPLLYVKRDSIPAVTAAALEELGIRRVFVVGSTGSISNAVLNALPNASRVVGNNRYQTSVKVANVARRRGVGTGRVYLTRSDMTRNGILVGATGRLVLLSPKSSVVPVVRSFLENHVNRVTLMGGTGALDREVNRDACQALN